MHSTGWKILLALAFVCSFGVQTALALGSTPASRQAQIDQATAHFARSIDMAEGARQGN